MRILILEDDLEVLSLILKGLYELEEKNKSSIAVTVFSEYRQVEDYVNKTRNLSFDWILLDRDSKEAGSFHILDLNIYDPKKVIAISSIPQYNEEARNRGVDKIVLKELDRLDEFVDEIVMLLSGTVK